MSCSQRFDRVWPLVEVALPRTKKEQLRELDRGIVDLTGRREPITANISDGDFDLSGISGISPFNRPLLLVYGGRPVVSVLLVQSARVHLRACTALNLAAWSSLGSAMRTNATQGVLDSLDIGGDLNPLPARGMFHSQPEIPLAYLAGAIGQGGPHLERAMTLKAADQRR